ncbi:hypothetical protein ABZ647_13725 [Micromonospora aurantiaca]|uniref:hypothetical protein n=1 Tax=Micromonospora TaxID=1873 RepID=UPI0008D9848F|nr:hypothetical protein [Micromonospora sp. WMMB235]OHX06285.1 hypothetical protein BFV98_26515 [Micromonospora sp. WMMB235]
MGYDVTVRRFGLYVAVAAMLLTASACGRADETPGTPTAVAASTDTESPTPMPSAPTATPSLAPEPSPTPRPSPTSRSSGTPRSSTAPAAPTTTKKATQVATASNKVACTAVKGPLEKAIAGLIILVGVASTSTVEAELVNARAEASTRLVNLEAVANRVAGEQTDRTLQKKFQVLTMAAGRKDVEVRSIKPKLEYAEAIVKVASDTGDLESAVDKLEPTCGRYW